jgi:hypothetical protein
MVPQTAESMSVLNAALLKAWKHYTKHVENDDAELSKAHSSKIRLASAAQSLDKAGQVVGKKAQKMASDLVGIDCSSEVASRVLLLSLLELLVQKYKH